MKISFKEVIELLFLPVLSAGVFVLWDMNKSVNALNVQVGVLIATNSGNEQRIKNLEEKFSTLQNTVTEIKTRR